MWFQETLWEQWFTPLATELFVDSVSGNDSSNGRTPETAFQSLDRVSRSLRAGQTVFLKSDSLFREEIVDWPSGVIIDTYGVGARPIIDGRDIAVNASFSKTGGQTNVYEIDWTHDFDADGGKSAHRAWEDGTMLTRAANLAGCDSTPGSFYAAAPTDGGPDTIYVHPTGSTNPISDGKEYSFAKRRWCVQLYTSYKQANVTGLETVGNSFADGSLCADGYVEDCIALDGRIHNCFILGEAYNCQALRTEAGTISTMFVSYVDNSGVFGGPAARNILYRDCLADAQRTTTNVDGFYAHTDGVRFFDTIEYRDCRAVGCASAFGGIQAAKFVTYRCTYDDVLIAHGAIGLENFFLGGTGRARASVSSGGLLYVITAAAVDYVVRGCKVYVPSLNLTTLKVNAPSANLDVQRCTITAAPNGTTQFEQGNITFRKNVVSGDGPLSIGTTALQLQTFDADENCYWVPAWNNGVFGSEYPSHVDYISLATWRTYLDSVALGAGTDDSSIAQDPLVADSVNLDFTIENAAVLALGAGAEVDEEDDPELQAYWLANRVTEV